MTLMTGAKCQGGAYAADVADVNFAEIETRMSVGETALIDLDLRVDNIEATLGVAYEIHATAYGLSPAKTGAQNAAPWAAAVAAVPSNGVLVIDPGAYDIAGGATLLNKTNVVIVADGATLTQKSNITTLLTISGCTRVRIRGGYWVGVGTDYNPGFTTDAVGIKILGTSTKITVLYGDFYMFGFAAVLVGAGSSNIRVADCTMEGTGSLGNIAPNGNDQFGVYSNGVTQTGNLTVERCNISRTAQGVFWAGAWTSITINNNNIHDIDGQSCVYGDDMRNLNCTGNTFLNAGVDGAGIKIQMTAAASSWCQNIIVSCNTISGCKYPILVICATAVVNYMFKTISVMGNTVSGGAVNGIDCRGCQNLTIADNTINDCSNYGIRFEGNVVTLAKNTIVRTGSAAIYGAIGAYKEAWNGTHTYITGNVVLGSDGNLYEAQANGGQAEDPTTDVDETYWRSLANQILLRISDNVIADPFYGPPDGGVRYGMLISGMAGSHLYIRNNGMEVGHNNLTYCVFAYPNIITHASNNEFGVGCGTFRADTAVAMASYNTLDGWQTTQDNPCDGRGLGRVFSGTVAPGAGTHYRGDVCYNSAPSSGQPIGWVCTATANPGTWKAFGTVA